MFVGSAEYSAEPLKKLPNIRFRPNLFSAESDFDWFGKGSVRPNLILAGSVHH